MLFGTFSLSAVKLVLGLPWDLEILDGMYWQLRGDVQVINAILYPIGVHFNQYDPCKHDMTSRHNYVANG